MLNGPEYKKKRVCAKRYGLGLCAVLLGLILIDTSSAQSLNWEGQTGVFVTPLAYVIPSSDRGLGRPAVAYHFLDGGKVLGRFHQSSVTVGAFNRVEVGYTRNVHQDGSTAGLSPLWGDGFNVFHGKLTAIRELRSWRPAVSLGAVVRRNVRNVGGVIRNADTENEDYYAVVTKTVTQIPNLPLVFNAGYKVTDAVLLGLAGNATAYKGRAFGAFAFSFRGPGRSTLLFGSEFLQQPRSIQDLPGAVVPTTITYAVRIIPGGALPLRSWGVETPKLTIDLGVAQVAGTIMPGVNLQARRQFALGVSYGF